ncbi:hypothetical protein Tco_0322716 [Tanacetum coccineum]
MRIEESLNVTFNESLPEPKLSSSVEDGRIDEPIVQDLNESPLLQVNASDEGYPKSLKEARGHPIEQVIGKLNERTLRTYVKAMEVKQHCCFNQMKDVKALFKLWLTNLRIYMSNLCAMNEKFNLHLSIL